MSFSQNFELNLEKLSKNNPYLIKAIGDFNAKAFTLVYIENVASQFELHQTIKDPMHILENSISCIDEVFTSLPSNYLVFTIKLFTQNLILKSIIPYPMLQRFGTIKIQMMILSEE